MKDDTVEFLASVGPIDTKSRLEKALAGQWLWFSRYGDEIFEVLSKLDIPPLEKKKTAAQEAQAAKRALEVQHDGGEQGNTSTRAKRARTSASGSVEANLPRATHPRGHPQTPITPANSTRHALLPPSMTSTTPGNPYSHLIPSPGGIQWTSPYYPRRIYQHHGTVIPQTPAPRNNQFTPFLTPQYTPMNAQLTPQPAGPSTPISFHHYTPPSHPSQGQPPA